MAGITGDNCYRMGMTIDPKVASSDRAEPKGSRHVRRGRETWKYYRRHVLNGCFGNLKHEAYEQTKGAK